MLSWTLGILLAAVTGWVEIYFRDLHLALLAAMGFALLLSVISPSRPWMWGLLVGFAPAAAEFYLISRGEPILRGQVEVAFSALLPAFVGSTAGFAMRRMVARVFEKPPADLPTSISDQSKLSR
ncbi:MAG TPA: hypothetical protein VFM10_13290 [Terriglobales bacterium]|nr:hypothetical protein [Terriglobales bacterium]